MVHYERVEDELIKAIQIINCALMCDEDTGTDKAALKIALKLVNEAREVCRTAQEVSIKETLLGESTQHMNM